MNNKGGEGMLKRIVQAFFYHFWCSCRDFYHSRVISAVKCKGHTFHYKCLLFSTNRSRCVLNHRQMVHRLCG